MVKQIKGNECSCECVCVPNGGEGGGGGMARQQKPEEGSQKTTEVPRPARSMAPSYARCDKN